LVRNSSTNEEITNKFDDLLTVSYKIENMVFPSMGSNNRSWKHYTENLLNKDGVAILVPGQYRGTHSIGFHQGKYRCFKTTKTTKSIS
jgi:hypothetical protein